MSVNAIVRIGAWHAIEVQQKAVAAAETALFKVGEFIVADSRKRCPKDSGTLRRSAQASQSSEGGNPVTVVSYDTPYARRQHEDLSLSHRVGGPKFLENAVKDNQGKIEQYVGLEIGKAFR